ncbi:MAG: bifunctional [glutamate--ammonia ligase]-adenylyl-L-tyrosine phosphorylase/[glutamate--ammonia-ligase] adenylyltransferase, partial [Pseudomonadota bacterium]
MRLFDTSFAATFAATVPATLTDMAKRSLDRLLQPLDEHQRQALEEQISQDPIRAKQLIYAISGSDYVLQSCCRKPSLLFDWLLAGATDHPLTPREILHEIKTACSDERSLVEFDALLRHLRRRFISALYWRDLNGLADLQEVSSAMTAMAEGFVQQALHFHYRARVRKYGMPIGTASQMPQPLLVIGMGKLGGAELNVSSDIDLIFTFPESGETNAKAGQKAIDNQQFFDGLGKQLIKSLNENSADGFVFRVDMRLRPYGQSGSLTSNFQALENYYETQGRAWERFAMIKARVIAQVAMPDSSDSTTNTQRYVEQFYQIVQPFVYRKYVDYSTVESLRQLKAMIVQEAHRLGLADNIKLGAGGIRDIEFIAQCFQLIRGGRDRALQERNLLVVLDTLESMGQLQTQEAHGLRCAYIFLRRLEHRLQAYQDEQTQNLPEDELARARVAWLMAYDNWAACARDLKRHRDVVSHIFQALIAEPGSDQEGIAKQLSGYQSAWLSLGETAQQYLASQDFSDAASIVSALQQFKQSRNVMSLSASAREKLDRLLPQLLYTVAGLDKSEHVLQQLLTWLEAIVTRTSYLLLLVENPQALHHLVKLFASSSWVAQTLTQMPSLVDELLYPDNLYSVQSK